MSGREVQRRREGMARAYAASLVSTMRTPEGRATIWGILDKTGLHAELMTGSSHTFYNVGKRDVGLDLLGDLKVHCFAEYRQMEDEAIARQQRVAFEQEAEQKSDPTTEIFREDPSNA